MPVPDTKEDGGGGGSEHRTFAESEEKGVKKDKT